MKRWNRKIVSTLVSQKYPVSERGRRFRAGLRKSRKLATSRRAVWSKQLTRCLERAGLFQRSVDRGELGVQLGADAVHDGDDRKRDTGRDQSIFDCRSAGLVSAEFPNQCDHGRTMLPIYEATVNTCRESSPQQGNFGDENPPDGEPSSGLSQGS
jgi:hypothetical protein